MWNNEIKSAILDFINEYQEYRKNNPIDPPNPKEEWRPETVENLNLWTGFEDKSNYYEIEWWFSYEEPLRDENPILYSIKIDINDVLGNVMCAGDINEGFCLKIKPALFMNSKKTLIKFLSWIPRNFNNIKPKNIWKNASIMLRAIEKKYS